MASSDKDGIVHEPQRLDPFPEAARAVEPVAAVLPDRPCTGRESGDRPEWLRAALYDSGRFLSAWASTGRCRPDAAVSRRFMPPPKRARDMGSIMVPGEGIEPS